MSAPQAKKRRADEAISFAGVGFTPDEETALAARVGGNRPALAPGSSARFVAAAIYADLLPPMALADWLSLYAPEATPATPVEVPPSSTQVYKWSIYAAGHYKGAKFVEVLPDRAYDFLELVNPWLSLTAGKHDYWRTSFQEWDSNAYDGVASKPCLEMDPDDWPAQGSGPWYDRVGDEDGWPAYRAFLAGDTPERVLALWNHEAEKDAYKLRCAGRRAKIVMPAAVALLRKATTNTIDTAAYLRLFPGCPLADITDDWSAANMIAAYYGLTRPFDLKDGKGSYVTPLVRYADHFEGKAEYNNYDHIDPAKDEQ